MLGILQRMYDFIEEHSNSCEFFDDFGLLIQLCLLIICLLTLFYKRSIEFPKRPIFIWFLDTWKQVTGQSTQHFINLYISHKIGEEDGLKCEWYLNIYLVDTILGVLFCYLFLKLLTKIFSGTFLEFKTGDYGQEEDPQTGTRISNNYKIFRNFFYQVFWWEIIVILSKLSCLGIIILLHGVVIKIGVFLLLPFKGNAKLKLIIVMIVYPLILNLLNLWITDNVIKMDYEVKDNSHSLPQEADDEKSSLINQNSKEIETN